MSNTDPALPEKVTVLVADDDRTTRLLAQQALKVSGYSVLEALDGREAIERFGADHPDVVLLDVDMPEMDGFEVCRRIRRDMGSDVPVLMMTAMDDIESINRAYEVGATDFISKPINWILLGHRVRYLIRATLLGRELAKNQEKLFTAQRIAKLGWWEWNVRSNEFSCSKAAAELFGIKTSRFDGSVESLLHWVHEDDLPTLERLLDKIMNNGGCFSIDHRMVRNDVICHVTHHGEATRDGDGNLIRLLGTVQDISERKKAEDRIRFLAYYDSQTGLPNRWHFLDHLQAAIGRARRTNGHLAVIILDIDDFKKINDTLGHSAGDTLLEEVGTRLAKTVEENNCDCRGERLLARFGGDEFVILLPRIERAHDVVCPAQCFIDAVRGSFTVNNQEVFMTVSMGIGIFPDDGDTPELLLKNADTARCHAKSESRNNYRFYTRSMNEESLQLLVLENNLRRAIDQNEFRLYFQPKIDLTSGNLVGSEVLVRWLHPEEGLIAPGRFIPLAEENGLIVPIGRWIMGEACRQNMKWRKTGLPALKLSVNVSGRQFLEKDFIATVDGILADSGMDPQYLEIELTESFIMKDVEKRIQNLVQLKEMGISLAIDDFGTDYSSLNYLVRFPLDCLKIDRTFLVDIPKNKGNVTITSTIIALAKNLRLGVVAEGVETEGQLEYLRKNGCNEAQGFMFCKPVTLEEMERLLRMAKEGIPLPWQRYFA